MQNWIENVYLATVFMIKLVKSVNLNNLLQKKEMMNQIDHIIFICTDTLIVKKKNEERETWLSWWKFNVEAEETGLLKKKS